MRMRSASVQGRPQQQSRVTLGASSAEYNQKVFAAWLIFGVLPAHLVFRGAGEYGNFDDVPGPNQARVWAVGKWQLKEKFFSSRRLQPAAGRRSLFRTEEVIFRIFFFL